MPTQRPEPNTSYASTPTPEYADAIRWEAAKSLSRFLRIPAAEARDLLAAGAAGPEIRARRADPVLARRLLEKRFR
jgi:hypothetical protein